MYSTHEFGENRDDKSLDGVGVDGVGVVAQQVVQQVAMSSEEQAQHHAHAQQQQQQTTHQQLIVCSGGAGVLLQASSDDDDPLVKKRRVLPFKPKRFRPEWMMYDMFKDWLRPHPNPENAMCAACDSVIKAGKSELEKHAAGKKHLKNLSTYRKEMGLPEDDVIVIAGSHEMDESVGSATTYLQSNVSKRKKQKPLFKVATESDSEKILLDLTRMQAPCYRESMNEQVVSNDLMAPNILPGNSHLLTQDIKDAMQWTSLSSRPVQHHSQPQPPPQQVDVVAMDTSQMHVVHVTNVDVDAVDTKPLLEPDVQSHTQSQGQGQSHVQLERYFNTRKQQKYRKAWEDLPEFALWLEAVDNNFYKAKCKMCAKVMLADLSVLRLHAQGKRHMQLCDDFNKAKAALQSMASTPQSTGVPLAKPVIMSSIRKIVLPPGASASAARRLDADSSSDVRVEGISLSDLTTDHQSPTFSLESSFHDQTGVQVQQSPVAPRQPKPSSENAVFVSKAFVSKPAPPWKATAIVNGHVTRLELNDYKGRYVILFFYPQDFAAVCPTEILALSDRVSEFRALQTEIVACSVDSHLTHLTWCRMSRSDGGLANPKIPLLADPTHSISRDYGVLMSDVGHSLRAHFIIDRRGTIRHISINDINVGRSVDELLRMIQALQHVDEHETGCPADWKPGQPTV